MKWNALGSAATGMIATLATAHIAAAQQSQPATSSPAPIASPTSAPASTPTSSTAVLTSGDERVDKILDRLETREIQDVRAEVRWEVLYPIEDSTVVRIGQLNYRQDTPTAKFKAHFNKRIAGDRADPLDEIHLFDGRFYVELNSQTKTVSRREIRTADDKSNPFALKEGKFPLPFGQKKAEVLEAFRVERVDDKASAVPDTDHIRLTPRAGNPLADRFATIEFWVATDGKASGMPVRVRYGQLDGTGNTNSFTTLSFKDPEINIGLSPSVFELKTPDGYEQIVEPMAPVP